MNRTSFYGEYWSTLLALAVVFLGVGGGGDLARSDGESSGGGLAGVAADGGGVVRVRRRPRQAQHRH